MEFKEENLFNINSTDEELEEQIKLFLNEGGNGNGLVRMIMLNPMNGMASHTRRIMKIIESMKLSEK